jgi:DNA-binding response OmpR family regulator
MSQKILIVEDEMKLAGIVANFFTRDGYETAVETNGKRVLAKMKLEKPDLILMDVMLPGMTGFELSKKIKSIAKFKNIPIIATTGLTDANFQKTALKSGIDHFVAKPYEPLYLLKMVKTVLQSQPKTKEIHWLKGIGIGLFLFLALGSNFSANASPWTQEPGKSYQELKMLSGSLGSQVNYYGEYGLLSSVTLVGNFLTPREQIQNDVALKNEIGLVVNAFKTKHSSVSLQTLLLLEGQNSNQSRTRYEGRILLGHAQEGLPLFMTLEPGLRFAASGETQTVLRGIAGVSVGQVTSWLEYENIGENKLDLNYPNAYEQLSVKFNYAFKDFPAMGFQLTGSPWGTVFGLTFVYKQ